MSLVMTVTEAVAYIRQDFSDQSADQVLQVMQQVLNMFAPLYPMYTSIETFSSLVDGTQEYSFASIPASVREARYLVSSSDAGTILRPTSIDELDRDAPYWRGYTTSTPTQFYVTTAGTDQKVGLVPAPSQTSSASYPQVQVFRWDYALLAFSPATGYVTSLPAVVVCADALVYETMKRLAVRSKDANLPYYANLAQVALRSLNKQTLGKSFNADQSVVPASMRRGGVKV